MFWLVAAVLTLIVCAPLAIALRRHGTGGSAAQKDVALYRDQLGEIDRDLARGTLAGAEAETARTEVARRLLAADRRAAEETVPTGAGAMARGAGLLVVALVACGGVGLYAMIGAPGLPDMPLADRLAAAREMRDNRPAQAEAETRLPTATRPDADPEFLALIERLRKAVAQNPEDREGLRLLVENEARLGNFAAAYAAKRRLIALQGDMADAEGWTDLAELMILAAGGYVSPEAERALERALQADARNPRARYFSGLTLAQTGRPDIAYRVWAGLLQESAPSDPWVPLIEAQILRVAQAAGIPATDPGLRGPSAGDVEAAAELSAQDRREMIRGMVSGLAERLNSEGGAPAEWARLIRAYGVLGETALASDAWNRARAIHGDNPAALDLLREAARAAEVAN